VTKIRSEHIADIRSSVPGLASRFKVAGALRLPASSFRGTRSGVFTPMRFSPKAPPANCNGAADFPAVKRPFNVLNHRHLSTAFRPPTTPMRFLALQRFRPGRFTSSRTLPVRFGPSSGFGYPRNGFLPAQPCRPCFRPAALLGFTLQRLLTLAVEQHSCRSAPTGWFQARPLVRASTSGRRVLPPLGFAPQECPSPDCGCYPVTWLAPLLGFSSLRLVLRPAWLALQQTSARWLVRPPVTRQNWNCHSAY
jgi:hypothetical protein